MNMLITASSRPPPCLIDWDNPLSHIDAVGGGGGVHAITQNGSVVPLPRSLNERPLMPISTRKRPFRFPPNPDIPETPSILESRAVPFIADRAVPISADI